MDLVSGNITSLDKWSKYLIYIPTTIHILIFLKIQ